MGPSCRLLCLVVAYLMYLFIGATIFSAIEHPMEGEMIMQLQKERAKFLEENKCVKRKLFCKIMNPELYEQLIDQG